MKHLTFKGWGTYIVLFPLIMLQDFCRWFTKEFCVINHGKYYRFYIKGTATKGGWYWPKHIKITH